MEKITKRDMYEAIIEAVNGGEWKYDAAEVVEFCEKEIGNLDKKAAKAKDAAAKKKDETDTLCDAIVAVLTDELTSIPDITEKVEGEDITLGKVQYRLNKLVGLGLAEKGDITIPGGEGVKTRKVVGFKLPSSTDVE